MILIVVVAIQFIQRSRIQLSHVDHSLDFWCIAKNLGDVWKRCDEAHAFIASLTETDLKFRYRKARTGRNPQTGEPIKIPAKKVVKFRVAKAAKDSILGPKK